MKGRRALLAATTVAAALVLISASGKKSAQLQAGGRTIGGPVAESLAPGEMKILFFFQGFAEGGLDVCATLLNTGQGTVTLRMYGESGATSEVAPGRGVTRCEGDVDNSDALCAEGGKPCSFAWRVDEVSTGT
jgi:hypothetical protein